MLSFRDKIKYLESCLLQNNDNYADSIKTDIAIFLGSFDIHNSKLNFLNKLSSKDEILAWINKLNSRIILKFDEENEQLSDFISDYIEFG